MGDDERPDAPQLEAPTLGRLFGRRRDRSAEDAGTPEQGVDDAAPPSPAEVPTPPADWAPIEEPTPAPVDETAVLDPATAPGPAAPVPPAPVAPVPSAPAPVADLRPLRESGAAAEPPPARKAPRATLSVSGRVASAITGLVIGLLVVVLTAGSLALCESVRGVSSCGGGPGFALLVAVTVSMIALGGLMLRLARVPDPTSTSFLAVGLLCVLSLLFLIDVLDAWWMILVIPALSTATFVLSHWVTTAVVESD